MMAYDGRFLPTSICYDGNEVLPVNENERKFCSGQASFASFARFLAAKGGITETKALQFADRSWFEDIDAYRALKADIKQNGLKNPLIEYTEINGQKYVLRGNGRLSAAEDLGIADQLTFKKVELPFLDYRTPADI